MTEGNGDSMLSPFQRRLWALTYSCLYKFGCPVMFEVERLNVPDRQTQVIVFFVPRTHLRLTEVTQYIFDELADEIKSERQVGDTTIPGSSVHVMEFTGIDFYHTASEIEEMTHNIMNDLLDRLKPKH